MLRFHRFLAPTALSALLLSTLSAHADLQYTMQMSAAQDGETKPISTTTTYLKDGLERMDSITQIATFRAEERTISNAAKRETITIDPNLKIYVSEPLSLPGGTNADGMNTKPVGQAGNGKMVLTLGSQLLGTDKMLDMETRHYKTSMGIDSTGCCGTGHSDTKSETWMADIKVPTLSNAPFDWRRAFDQEGTKCKINFERRGDVDKYDAAQKGLALKTITSDASGSVLAIQEVTKLSLAPLPDVTFQAPTAFKKVTRSQYDQARQKAMVAAFTG